MTDHVTNRQKIVDALTRELVGPAPSGAALDVSEKVMFEKAEDAYGPFVQTDSGDEILQRDPPSKRYGLGVLHPAGARDEEKADGAAGLGLLGAVHGDSDEAPAAVDDQSKIEERVALLGEQETRFAGGAEGDELDLLLANSYRPSSIGVSFLADIPEEAVLVVEAKGGRYQAVKVAIKGQSRERDWWRRSAVAITASFAADALTGRARKAKPTGPSISTSAERLNLQIEVFTRPHGSDGRQRLLTVCLVNRTDGEQPADEQALFQAHFIARLTTPGGAGCILPYPQAPHAQLDEEERSLALLYRHAETYGIGHGCAADWSEPFGGRVAWVSAECLPMFETPSVTPEILRADGSPIEVSMAELAGLVSSADDLETLQKITDDYEAWIRRKEKDIDDLEERHLEAARRHMQAARRCLERMRSGIDYLKTDPLSRLAFRLANKAILLQQLQSRPEARRATFDEKKLRLVFDLPYVAPDLTQPSGGRGKWRAFQIAFLLMTIQSAAQGDDAERDTVELIWFPTGGGKTEAYLGLTAFTLFLRRLRNPADIGTHVLMRYTLRLLTAQQFQRAARLICAMEQMRSQNGAELGAEPFSLGLWVGGDNTPNTRQQALDARKELEHNPRARNPFVLDRCPWCGAQMGVLAREGAGGRRPKRRVLGYSLGSGTVVFKCPDPDCPFQGGLPVCVIDEDLYDAPPSMLIGTVDKFAMLAWRPKARALFGIGDDGQRVVSPPGLIIQDELHLISGPLGSMVGLYEAIIEELCTDRRQAKAVRPKVVCSTATIRRYAAQIRAVYGREQTSLFPPPGLEDGDSFFGRHAVVESGERAPGRLYVGVHAPGLGSMLTVQVRAFTALLQAPMALPAEARDPWWTLMVFFKSLREVGMTLSLLQSDIPDYRKVLLNRSPRDKAAWRDFSNIMELTGRASSDEIPKAIAQLETRYSPTRNASAQRAVDVCLATNILEVGVDIERLSLMCVIGQPKTTSQYIQVTGRVGRKWQEKPGLVVTVYGVTNPRDRSHFEKFRTYHERLYAQVEPTSVTPFSPPALERALHAALAVYARQMCDHGLAERPWPFPAEAVQAFKQIMSGRAQAVDPTELSSLEEVFDRRVNEWRTWQHAKWTGDWTDADTPLLRQAGDYVEPDRALRSWATPQSMRTVDAETITEIVLPPVAPRGTLDA